VAFIKSAAPILVAVAAASVIVLCGLAAFLGSIHGSASLHIWTRICFPFMALADLDPVLDNYYVYFGCGILSFLLWVLTIYVFATRLRRSSPMT
jgi:hypothetical protein